ncbi:MAG: hypothetical protein M3N04_02110 [Actinomycetota bacterium]|nr:hypothetical protein [Actinomycetota bacterium]
MSESPHDKTSPEPSPVQKPESDPAPVEKVRTKEPEAPFGQDEPNPNVVSDATADEQGSGERDPGLGGYDARDPASDMPRVPSAPETQDDPPEHGAAPETDREPPASH